MEAFPCGRALVSDVAPLSTAPQSVDGLVAPSLLPCPSAVSRQSHLAQPLEK